LGDPWREVESGKMGVGEDSETKSFMLLAFNHLLRGRLVSLASKGLNEAMLAERWKVIGGHELGIKGGVKRAIESTTAKHSSF
jgi:hypothetical protein